MNAEMRIVVVLNKAYALERLTSALGHVCAGLGASQGRESMSLVEYRDQGGQTYPNISDYSVIILRGGAGQIRTFWDAIKGFDRPRAAYTSTMFEGGSTVQQAVTLTTPTADVELIAVATLGTREELDHLTKKFSLWR